MSNHPIDGAVVFCLFWSRPFGGATYIYKNELDFSCLKMTAWFFADFSHLQSETKRTTNSKSL